MTRFLPVLSCCSQSRTAAAQDAARVAQGKQVYTAQKCQVCHSVAASATSEARSMTWARG